MRKLGALILLATTAAIGQTILDPEVVDMRIAGPNAARLPIVVEGRSFQVELDMRGSQPIDLRVRIVHCDMEWRQTESEFLNDPSRMLSRQPTPYREAAQGTKSFRWTYTCTLPGIKGIETISYSGNYVATFIDAEDLRPLAEVRFIVGERGIDDAISVVNRRLPSAVAPWNRGHAVRIKLTEERFNAPESQFNMTFVRSVVVYKNREFGRPYTIDVNDRDEQTWVERLGTGSVTFVAGAILPGNEYRSLDIRSLDHYPPGDTIRLREGADVSRFFSPGPPDHNGSSEVVNKPFAADLQPVEFQFLWPGDGPPPQLNIVGDFNGWTIRPDWGLTFDPVQGRYGLVNSIRRGRYDYQYVMNATDWVTAEGNEWSTTNVYTAVVYYRELSLGGYDKVLGVGQVISNVESSIPKEKSGD